MSYILDALRKAESDRHLDQTQDIRAAITAAPPALKHERRIPLPALMLMIILSIALLIVVAFYFLTKRPDMQLPWASSSSEQSASRQPVMKTIPVIKPAQVAPQPSSRQQSQSAPATQRATTAYELPATASTSRLSEPVTQDDTSSAAAANDDFSRGSVPISDSTIPARQTQNAGRSATDSSVALPLQRASAATQTLMRGFSIDAMMASSKPGRSFIMVGGKIYKTGSVLPNGVEIINIGQKKIELQVNAERFYIPAN